MKRLARLSTLCPLLAAFACGGGGGTPDASTECTTLRCGTACCASGEVCYQSACCAPVACGDKQCGDDSCGTSCGVCGSGDVCNYSTSKCIQCQPESNSDFCTRLKMQCGSVTNNDNCGDARTVSECGPCSNGKGCAADHTCTGPCQPESLQAFCAAGGKNCGSYSSVDNCQQTRVENCGTCPNSGDCVDNVCPCQPEDNPTFCARMAQLGKVCGLVNDEDNCGNQVSVDCGTTACTGGQCSASTNKCCTTGSSCP